VETLSLCGRPTLVEATRHIGRTVIHLTSTGDPAQVLSQPPQNGPPAQNAICLPSLPREKKDGEPINSGDTVSLRSNDYGSSHRLFCGSSSISYCHVLVSNFTS